MELLPLPRQSAEILGVGFRSRLLCRAFFFGPDSYCYRCALGLDRDNCGIACANYIDQMIEFEGGSDKVAAVIVEPIVGSNGIIPPPAE